jgi:hypothetical protein
MFPGDKKKQTVQPFSSDGSCSVIWNPKIKQHAQNSDLWILRVISTLIPTKNGKIKTLFSEFHRRTNLTERIFVIWGSQIRAQRCLPYKFRFQLGMFAIRGMYSRAQLVDLKLHSKSHLYNKFPSTAIFSKLLVLGINVVLAINVVLTINVVTNISIFLFHRNIHCDIWLLLLWWIPFFILSWY